MDTLNIDVQAIANEVATKVVNGIDFESVLANGSVANGDVEYRNIEYVPSNYTATDNLLKAAHALMVDSGTILKRPFVGLAMAGVRDGVFQVQRGIEGGDIVIVSAPMLEGQLNTTKLTVGNHLLGEVNLFKEVTRHPLKNGVRLTKMYTNIERAFNEYEKTLKELDQTILLESELKDLQEELATFEAAKQTRLRKLAVRELKNQVEIVEGLLAKR